MSCYSRKRFGSSTITLMAGIAVGATFVGSLVMTLQPTLPEMPKMPEAPRLPPAPKLPDAPKLPSTPKLPDAGEVGSDAAKKAAEDAKKEMEKMTETWTKAAEPGAMHARLDKTVGTWKGTNSRWSAPGMSPVVSECTTVITSMMEGRYTMGKTSGVISKGDQESAYEGMGIYGYNNTTKEFESTWLDNHSTMITNFIGSANQDASVITWTGNYTDPTTNKPTTMRLVERLTNNDAMKLEFYISGPDGKEFKNMEINYTRVK